MRPSFHRFRPLYVATQTLPSFAPTIDTLLMLDSPCLIEIFEMAYSRNRSIPLVVTAQMLLSSSQKSTIPVAPKRPPALEKTSLPALVGGNRPGGGCP